MTSPPLDHPVHLNSHEAYIATDGSIEDEDADSLTEAAKALYPSARVVAMPIADYAQLLESTQTSELPTVLGDLPPSLC